MAVRSAAIYLRIFLASSLRVTGMMLISFFPIKLPSLRSDDAEEREKSKITSLEHIIIEGSIAKFGS